MLWDICMDVYIGDCSVRECFCHLSVLSFMFLPACQISSDESKKKRAMDFHLGGRLESGEFEDFSPKVEKRNNQSISGRSGGVNYVLTRSVFC